MKRRQEKKNNKERERNEKKKSKNTDTGNYSDVNVKYHRQGLITHYKGPEIYRPNDRYWVADHLSRSDFQILKKTFSIAGQAITKAFHRKLNFQALSAIGEARLRFPLL